ncbi:MAG TPA: carotenoid oxygenase family protein [Hyphomicrobiales bacterium]|nr:carotenoid oxygenase family protein [Hyphomicrobiales bacterium]
MTHPFPHSPDYAGHNAPMRVECDIYDLVVEGEIPKEINGVWYRSIPDPQYPPRTGDDVFISGDGMVNALFFEDGHADYKLRYVMSERLRSDRAARRSLFGRYRNPYTDDASVREVDRGVYNTTPIYHGGRLLALKEDSVAMELDPFTLATRGRFDFDGSLQSRTMTAHPRLDPDTGELYFFGYEANGLCSDDVAYCIADRRGQLISEQWFKVPYVSLMHDFAITKEHALFPVFPTTSRERLEAGEPHWHWDGTKPSYVGIMPRNGSVRDLRWFEGPPCFAYHVMNAFTEGNLVHLDLCVADINMFPFIMTGGGYAYEPARANARLARWTFDLAGADGTWRETVIGPGGDMPRVAPQDMNKPYRIGYMTAFDPRLDPPIPSGPTPAGFNCLLRLDLASGAIASWHQQGVTIQEPVFIASRQDAHEGYLAAIADLHASNTAQVLLFAAADLAAGPIARLHLPLRQRCGVHGNWVPAEAFV